MRHPRQVLTRGQIYERVWDYDFGPLSNSLERLHRIPATQARGGRRAARDPDRARHGLRAARAGTMTLRTRLALAAGLAVALAVAAAAVVVYFAVRSELRGEIDDSLRERATLATDVLRVAPRFERRVQRSAAGGDERPRPARRRLAACRRRRTCRLPHSAARTGVIQLVRADGTLSGPDRGGAEIPVDERIRNVAARHRRTHT